MNTSIFPNINMSFVNFIPLLQYVGKKSSSEQTEVIVNHISAFM